MRGSLNYILGEIILWIAIFIIALAGFLYLDDILNYAGKVASRSSQQPSRVTQDSSQQQESSGNGRVTLHANRAGHFEVRAYINDRPVRLMADTGATFVVLRWEDAESLDLTYDLEFTGRARTANGTSQVAPVTLDRIEVGDIVVENVRAFVARRGMLGNSLLGMSFIGRLESFQMRGRELILVQ